jgi:hypothetical protein
MSIFVYKIAIYAKDENGKTKKIKNRPDFLKYRGKDEKLAYPKAKKLKQKGGENEK